MKCPCCGAAELVHDIRDMPFIYKGESTTIPRVGGDFCPACGESILGATESERVMRAMQIYSKQVDAAHAHPGYINTVRRKLNLNQRQPVEIFGGVLSEVRVA